MKNINYFICKNTNFYTLQQSIFVNLKINAHPQPVQNYKLTSLEVQNLIPKCGNIGVVCNFGTGFLSTRIC